MGKEILPEHMSVAWRNQRLYDTLKGMGLFTSVVLCRDDPTKIDQIVVSAGLPTVELLTADMCLSAPVGLPLERPEVADVVSPSLGSGSNVINFPTMV